MLVHDYDATLADRTKNLTPPPEDAREEEETDMFTYRVLQDDHKADYWINCFLMPWIPE